MKQSRIDRLRSGNWSFGCAGTHRGWSNNKDCPAWPHHHHDDFCEYPTLKELRAAGIDPKKFESRSRK